MAGPGKKISGLLTCTKIYCNDLADQILDSQKNPEWQGQCTKMVYAFPTDTKLWDKYEEIRAESLRAGNGGKEATEFYIQNRAAMDVGSKAAWPQRHNEDEVSAIQHAMNLMLRDEVAFYAEYQNDPIAEQSDEQVLTIEQVMEKTNGRKRGEVPLGCQYLTMFIDVHDKLLFYVVVAWSDDFTGYVVDYGTYPDQKRLSFTLRKAQISLQDIYRGMEKEGAIQVGLEKLCGDYLNRDWNRGTSVMKIDRCLIDGGYLPGIVENIRHKLGGTIMASKGVGIRAASKPMSTYKRKPGERHGHHWYIPNINKTGEFTHVAIDTNYWKTFVHERFFVAAGDHGSMTLFGKGAHQHSLFAEHVAGSEIWVRTEGHGRVVYQWSPKIGGLDNHWLDCMVGCSVAASMCGCSLSGHNVKAFVKRERIKLSDIQRKRQL
ncbi:MAG: Phage terminase large subunit (GpA) [Planctomycetes bacterium ADurb.Bin401]|nr:MAG: Phage terminase large subunit (GpA) [Planctomycetes bacterium ADurb.Bin401]